MYETKKIVNEIETEAFYVATLIALAKDSCILNNLGYHYMALDTALKKQNEIINKISLINIY